MTIVQPDWISGLLGGLMIGLAGAIFLLGNGRIMG
ncbi:MAG: YeeE/YedE family protein, partial [Marinovum sp.]|nr:YeeE/YedE family protein [Marinovum sp.]